jgi:putative methyltransferase (TIGR04325 family)
MEMRRRIAGLADRASTLPVVRPLLERLFERRFAREVPETNLYRGVFATFAEAAASAPSTRPSGYDNEAAASLYRDRTRRVYPSDYAAMLWFSKLFGEGAASVFDIGGHIGIGYYAYQKYVDYPPNLRWTVLDVPAVVESGRAYAKENDAPGRLAFTTRPEDIDGNDIVFASGSLQYLDYTLAELIGRVARPPRHLLINLTPIHVTESFFTLQNMGAAYCAYRISSEREFLGGLRAAGYQLRDRWENLDRRCKIAYRPEHSLDRYYGFCFSR